MSGHSRPSSTAANHTGREGVQESMRYMKELKERAGETNLPALKQSFYAPDVTKFYAKTFGINNLTDYDKDAGFSELYKFVSQSTRKGGELAKAELDLVRPYRDLVGKSVAQFTAEVKKKIKGSAARLTPDQKKQLEAISKAYNNYMFIESYVRNRIFAAHEVTRRGTDKIKAQVDTSWLDSSREGIKGFFDVVGKKNRNLSVGQMWLMIGGGLLFGVVGYQGLKKIIPDKFKDGLKKYGWGAIKYGGTGALFGSLAYKWWTGNWPLSDAKDWYNQTNEVPRRFASIFCKLNSAYCKSTTEVNKKLGSAGRVLTYAGSRLTVEQALNRYNRACLVDEKNPSVSVPGLVLKSELSDDRAGEGLAALDDLLKEGNLSGLKVLAKNHPGKTLIVAFYAELARRGVVGELVAPRKKENERLTTPDRIIGRNASLDYLSLHARPEISRRRRENASVIFGIPSNPDIYGRSLFQVANEYFKKLGDKSGGVTKAQAMAVMTDIGRSGKLKHKKVSEIRKDILKAYAAKYSAQYNSDLIKKFRKSVSSFNKFLAPIDRNVSLVGGASKQLFVRNFKGMLGSSFVLAQAGDMKARRGLASRLKYFGLKLPKNTDVTRRYDLYAGKAISRAVVVKRAIDRTGYAPGSISSATSYNRFVSKVKGDVLGARNANAKVFKDFLIYFGANNQHVPDIARVSLKALYDSYQKLISATGVSYSPASASKLLDAFKGLKRELKTFNSIWGKRKIQDKYRKDVRAQVWAGSYEKAMREFAGNEEYNKMFVRGEGVLPEPKKIIDFVLNREIGPVGENFEWKEVAPGQFLVSHKQRKSLAIKIYKVAGKWKMDARKGNAWQRDVKLNGHKGVHSLLFAGVTAMDVIDDIIRKQVKPNASLDLSEKKQPFSSANGKIYYATGTPTSWNPFGSTLWKQALIWRWGFDKNVKSCCGVDPLRFAVLLNKMWVWPMPRS